MGLLGRPSHMLTWLPPSPLLQDEAEALVELQGRLQEAQDTTEALRVQVGAGPRGQKGWGTGERGI